MKRKRNNTAEPPRQRYNAKGQPYAFPGGRTLRRNLARLSARRSGFDDKDPSLTQPGNMKK